MIRNHPTVLNFSFVHFAIFSTEADSQTLEGRMRRRQGDKSDAIPQVRTNRGDPETERGRL